MSANYLVRCTLGMAGALVASPLIAQTADNARAGGAPAATGAASADAFLDQDIVVTARRKAESQLDVPAAITALSADTLRNERINDTVDIALLTPGLTAQSAQGSKTNLTFNIRGLGTAAAGGVPSVIIYADEIPIGILNSPLFDLDSVQVLKGPQGTLFGASSNGGAVLLTTVRASTTAGVSGYAELSGGTYKYREFKGAINLPIVSDLLAVRVAADIIRRDGTTKVINQPGLRFDEKHSNSVRVSARLTPASWLRNDTIYEYFRSKTSGPGFVIGYASPTNTCGAAGFQNFVCAYGYAAVQAEIEAQQRRGPWKVQATVLPAGTPPYQENQQFQRITNITDVTLSDQITLRNIFAYNWTRSFPVSRSIDLDGSIFVGYEIANRNAAGADPSDQLTNELQVQADFAGIADIVAGGFYRKNTQPAGTFINIRFPAFPVTTAPGFASNSLERSLYAQATFDGAAIGARDLSLTVGGRSTWSRSRGSIGRAAAAGGEVVFRDKAFTYNISLDYKPSETLLLYVAHRKGYKPGGTNGSILTTLNATNYQSYESETLKDVEIGVKSRFDVGGMTASLNAAAYHSWYDNAQRVVNVSGSSSINVNADKAKVKGFEIDGALEPVAGLNLAASYAYVDPKFDRFIAPNFGNGLATTPVVLRDLSNDAFAGTAKHTLSIRAAYELPFVPEESGKLVLSATYFRQSGTFIADENAGVPASRIPGYGLVNGRLDWRGIAGTPVDVALFVNNLTKKAYATGGVSFSLPSQGLAQYYYGEPRTVGVELRVQF